LEPGVNWFFTASASSVEWLGQSSARLSIAHALPGINSFFQSTGQIAFDTTPELWPHLDFGGGGSSSRHLNKKPLKSAENLNFFRKYKYKYKKLSGHVNRFTFQDLVVGQVLQQTFSDYRRNIRARIVFVMLLGVASTNIRTQSADEITRRLRRFQEFDEFEPELYSFSGLCFS